MTSPTLLDAWHATVRRAPRASAAIDAATGDRVSRRALAARAADRATEWQVQLGVQQLDGRWVVFAQPNGAEWLARVLALWQLGAVPVPLDPTEPPAAQAATARALRAHYWLAPDGEWHALPVLRRRAAPDIAVVKLTSGSTGTPRALPFTHAQMLADGRNIVATMGLRGADTNVGLVPLGHSYGLGNLVVPLLVDGIAVAFPSSPLPHALAAEIAAARATVFPAVPAVLRALATADLAPESLASLRTVISAGAPLAPEIAQRFADRFGRCVHNFYGTTETGGIAYDRTGESALTGRGVGTALEGVTLALARGGRLRVTGAAVGTGGRPGIGSFLVGDRARLDPTTGEVTLLGRLGRVVKIGGRRLDLAELEATLKRLPGISEAHAAPHPEQPDALAVAVATDLTPAAVRALLAVHLAPWKVPRRLVVRPEFPLTARGKIDTARVRAWLRGS